MRHARDVLGAAYAEKKILPVLRKIYHKRGTVLLCQFRLNSPHHSPFPLIILLPRFGLGLRLQPVA